MKEKKLPAEKEKQASKLPEHLEEEIDPGQRTILNVPPSKFEQLVDEVLKKHKI